MNQIKQSPFQSIIKAAIYKRFLQFLQNVKQKIRVHQFKFNKIIFITQEQEDLLKNSSDKQYSVQKLKSQSLFKQIESRGRQIQGLMVKYQTDKIIQLLNTLQREAQQILIQLENKTLEIYNQINKLKIYIISFFFKKYIKNLNLLYRASDNNYSIASFWQKCHNKPNTLTVLKTQFGKIIGGFTPIVFNRNLNGYKLDNTKQSFLFSITQNHKIPLIIGKQSQAIYHNTTYGPVFGSGPDLLIQDNSKVNKTNKGNIGVTYKNGQYSQNQQSKTKFIGQSQGNEFGIEEWQVYEVIFD